MGFVVLFCYLLCNFILEQMMDCSIPVTVLTNPCTCRVPSTHTFTFVDLISAPICNSMSSTDSLRSLNARKLPELSPALFTLKLTCAR